MKFKDIIERLDKDKSNSSEVLFMWMKCDLDLEHLDVFHPDERMEGYWIFKRHDYGCHVGMKAYFLDNELVCVSTRTCRGSSEQYEWVSKEAAIQTRDYIQSLEPNPFCQSVKFIKMEKEMKEMSVEWIQDISKDVKALIYQDEECEIIRGPLDAFRSDTVLIQQGDKKIEVDLKKCRIPWRISTKTPQGA